MSAKQASPLEALFAILPGKLLMQLAIDHQVDKVNQTKLPGKTVFLCLLSCVMGGLLR